MMLICSIQIFKPLRHASQFSINHSGRYALTSIIKCKFYKIGIGTKVLASYRQSISSEYIQIGVWLDRVKFEANVDTREVCVINQSFLLINVSFPILAGQRWTEQLTREICTIDKIF